MMTKIRTPMGCICFEDERMAENAKTIFAGVNKEKEINEIVLKEDDAKKNYNTASPYGCGYTNRYEKVLSTKNEVMKLYAGRLERDIAFIEIS